MISTNIIDVIYWLAEAGDELSSGKAPTAILDQVSRPQPITNQIKRKLNFEETNLARSNSL